MGGRGAESSGGKGKKNEKRWSWWWWGEQCWNVATKHREEVEPDSSQTEKEIVC